MELSAQGFSVSSTLRASPQTLWQHASTLRGVNQELWPLRLSGPDSTLLTRDIPLQQPVLRSVVSLLGVVMLDLHEFSLVHVTEGEGFHEHSRSLLERSWRHVRTIRQQPGGCVVTDELEFEPRLFPGLVGRIVRRVFEHRHAFLRRRFGELAERAP
jgi:hypothetical protein